VIVLFFSEPLLSVFVSVIVSSTEYHAFNLGLVKTKTIYLRFVAINSMNILGVKIMCPSETKCLMWTVL
jgi:hypothetical protein